jgi:phosphoribosyl-AMP cyclohydrolase
MDAVDPGSVRFGADGLVPAIAQAHGTGEVLMLAWMDRAALEETLRTGWATYWSRSRQGRWRKGESSGHVQRVIEIRIDCDADAVLLIVEQTGAACHTGERSCFYRKVSSFSEEKEAKRL